MLRSFDLSGRVAVVIGATSGLGRTMALGLAEAGADVVPSGRRESLVQEVCQRIEHSGRRSLSVPVDVRDRRSVDALRDRVLERFGRADILLYAAGAVARKPTLTVTEEEWSSTVDVNASGALRACQSFYEPLAKSGRGRIINIVSLNSFVSLKEVAAYAAAKSALLSLTRSLALEWAASGINVNAIAPGVIDTPMWDLVDAQFARYENLPLGEKKRQVGAAVPYGRMGLPQDIAGAAVFLASADSDYIVAQTLNVDGGNWMS